MKYPEEILKLQSLHKDLNFLQEDLESKLGAQKSIGKKDRLSRETDQSAFVIISHIGVNLLQATGGVYSRDKKKVSRRSISCFL